MIRRFINWITMEWCIGVGLLIAGAYKDSTTLLMMSLVLLCTDTILKELRKAK